MTQTTSCGLACIPITEPFCSLTNTLHYMSQMCAVYVGSVARADKRRIVHPQYTVHSCTEGTDFRTSQQQVLRAESRLDMSADYRQWQWWVPVWCGCYRGWGMLWRSFTGTTSVITERVYSAFQCSGFIQPGFSQYLWRRGWSLEWGGSLDTTDIKITVNIVILPQEECCICNYKGPERKEWQQSTTHHWHLCSTLAFSC